MLASDHPHLFETGGENYHTDFTVWDYVRGHEGDPWRTYPDLTGYGAPILPARPSRGLERPYDISRTYFRAEHDFPGPRTMEAAATWLNGAAGHHDRWLLFVDEFDPHEPFDTPEPWAGRYDPDWDGELVIWPPYDVGAVTEGRLSEREGRQIRANYGAKLSMIDHWFGRMVAALDDRALWDTTAVIVCTDHGHYLGEKDIWGKPGVMQYETLGHMPLLVHWPGVPGGSTCDALTTGVDLFATIADVFGVTAGHRTHGRSLVPLLDGNDHLHSRLGDRRGLRELGADHRRNARSTPVPRRATTSRCRCGRTGGRPCRCTASRTCSLHPTSGRASTSCPAATCR